MSKTVKRFLILELLLFIVYFVFLIICRLTDLDVNESSLLVIFQLIVLISTFVFLFAILITSIKQGFSNVKKCVDPVFTGIDKHKECWEESDNFYLKLIQIINYYYKENGKVDELISNQEITRLYGSDGVMILFLAVEACAAVIRRLFYRCPMEIRQIAM